jgi:hypothetical protein
MPLIGCDSNYAATCSLLLFAINTRAKLPVVWEQLKSEDTTFSNSDGVHQSLNAQIAKGVGILPSMDIIILQHGLHIDLVVRCV